MATYRFGKWNSCDGYDYFVIEKKGFWGWSTVKTWYLGFNLIHKDYSKELEQNQKQLMMEAVDRLVKAGNSVI